MDYESDWVLIMVEMNLEESRFWIILEVKGEAVV